MTIVAGFDVHRAQITFDALIQETGEVHRGRIAATPEAVGRWVGRFPGERVHVAVEACTGWLFVCEALGEGRRRAPRRDDRDARPARQEAARQDRPHRRALAAHTAGGGSAARGLDPARARARVAHPHPPAEDARRRAHGLAGASPSDAV
jgi:hypothetical protein